MSSFSELSAVLAQLRSIASSLKQPSVDVTPILLANTSDSSTRVLRENMLTLALSEVSELLSVATSIEVASTSLRTKLELWHARIIEPMRPVSALPEDVLLLIFSLVIEGSTTPWAESMTISQVCSRWRTVSVEYAKMWSVLSLAVSSQAPLINLFAHRAQSRRIELRLEPKNENYSIKVRKWPPQSIPIDATLAPRIGALHITSGIAFQTLVPTEDALGALDISIASISGVGSYSLSSDTIAIMQKVHTLCFRGYMDGLGVIFSSSRLQRLILDSWDNSTAVSSLSNAQMMNVPNLQLELRWLSDASRSGADSRGTVIVDAVRSLVIRECHPNTMSLLGKSLVLKNLTSLTIILTDNWPNGNFGQNLHRQAKNTLIQIVPRLRHLIHLSITLPYPRDVPQILEKLVPTLPSDPIPSLESLEFILMGLRMFDEEKCRLEARSLLEAFQSGHPGSHRAKPLKRLGLSRKLIGLDEEWYTANFPGFVVVDDDIAFGKDQSVDQLSDWLFVGNTVTF